MSFEETPDTGLRLDEIMSGAWSQAELVDALQDCSRRLRRRRLRGCRDLRPPRERRARVVAVSGNADAREELLGKRRALSTLEADIAMADWWGPLCFVPEERVIDRLEDPGWVPDVTPVDDVNAWKPLDFLFSPLRDDVGDPVGVLAVDLPADGLRPDEDRQRLLQRYAEYSAKAVNALLARERLTERLRLAGPPAPSSAPPVPSSASTGSSPTARPRSSRASAPRASGSRPSTTSRAPSTAWSSPTPATPSELPGDMMAVAHEAARALWDSQRVVITTRRRPPSSHDPLTEDERNQILDFLDSIGIGRCSSSPWERAPSASAAWP